MKLLRRFLLIYLLAVIAPVVAESPDYYFYQPEIQQGSELVFHPLTVVLQGSYDILRNGSHTKNVFEQPYQEGFTNVMRNLAHPFENIEQYGKREFFQRELFNLSLDANRSQFMPNISLHIFGNGMQYVKMAEWYDYHGYSNPYLLSGVTTVFYQFMNEIVENGAYSGPNVDPIADILIFNTIGLSMFSFDIVKQFFAEKIPIYDWSPLPFYNPLNYNLENAGQQYATKIRLFPAQKYRAFMYFGVQSIFGISYQLNQRDHISCGVGAVIYRLTENRFNGSRLITPNMEKALGVFFDRDNSLLASLIITGPQVLGARCEVFPGVLDFGPIKSGFLMEIGGMEGFQFGISTALFPAGMIYAL